MSRDDDLDLHFRGEGAGPQPRPALGLEVGDPDAPRDPAPADGAAGDPYGRERLRGPRMLTIVFGLVLLAITGVVTATDVADADIDPWAFVITLMIGIGVLLLAGSLRRRHD